MDPAALGQALVDLSPLAWVAAAALLLGIGAATAVAVRRRRRRRMVRQRYGAEFERTARRAGSRRQAEAVLRAREARRADYDVRVLSAGERERLRARWEALQASFVDDPEVALQAADDLLAEVAVAKGYAGEDPLEDVGVDHPRVVDRYRATTPTAAQRVSRDRDTEALRLNLLAAREVLEALLGPDTTQAPTPTPFQQLVAEDEPAPATADTQPADGPTDADGGSNEVPLYGPDGRPLTDTDDRPRVR